VGRLFACPRELVGRGRCRGGTMQGAFGQCDSKSFMQARSAPLEAASLGWPHSKPVIVPLQPSPVLFSGPTVSETQSL